MACINRIKRSKVDKTSLLIHGKTYDHLMLKEKKKELFVSEKYIFVSCLSIHCIKNKPCTGIYTDTQTDVF